jgi:hypothetical protein
LLSGKRQHFIPQFLQEGFASHTSGEKTFTWMYRKGVPPSNPNIINVGVEGRFYTEGQDTEADDLITSAEGTFGTLIRDLRADLSAPLSDPQLPLMIAHLEVRTRHLRENFLQTSEALVSRLLDFLSDDEVFAAFLIRRFQSDPSMFLESFAEEFAKHKLPKELLDPFMQLVAPLFPALIQQQRTQFPQFAAVLRLALPRILKNAAKSGHIRTLKRSIAPELRVQRYTLLTYAVVKAIETPLILGDSVVLFDVQGPRRYKAFLDRDDTLNAVLLPLDPGRVLVGARDGFTGAPSGLREAIARCSLEYFIATENSCANELLRDQIGMDAALLTQAELEDMVNELMQE